MIKPPFPEDELLRLETLRNLKILDTDPAERFDRITRLAKRICGTQIALVSLVDNDRQWFKSRQGLDATETSRDISFCGHAILDDQTMVVNDTLSDERFCDNPLVMGDPNIRFYAGYPLKAPDGNRVGTLCIIDDKPRDIDAGDIGLLESLGHMVEEELVIASIIHNDPVTGLSNSAGFFQITEYLLAMCVRTKSPVSLMLCHLINQNVVSGFMGLAEGDRAAIEMAQLLQATFRDSDVIGRLSDDVFAVLMAGSQLESVEAAEKRLIEKVQKRNLGGDSEYELDVETCAADYDPEKHDDVEALLSDAENRMEEKVA